MHCLLYAHACRMFVQELVWRRVVWVDMAWCAPGWGAVGRGVVRRYGVTSGELGRRGVAVRCGVGVVSGVACGGVRKCGVTWQSNTLQLSCMRCCCMQCWVLHMAAWRHMYCMAVLGHPCKTNPHTVRAVSGCAVYLVIGSALMMLRSATAHEVKCETTRSREVQWVSFPPASKP
jgi:hypothetical protein